MDRNRIKIKHKPFKVFKSSGGWICTAHRLIMYEDGTIEWGYSTDGHFEKGLGEYVCV